MNYFDYYKRKCKECGKIFYATLANVYKIEKGGGKFWWFCNYSCKRKYEKDHPRRNENYWFHK